MMEIKRDAYLQQHDRDEKMNWNDKGDTGIRR